MGCEWKGGTMRISVQAIGTRGDVQPMLAVAGVLVERGHRVAVTVNRDLAGFVRGCGFEVAHPFDLDFDALMRRLDARGAMAGWRMWFGFWRHVGAAGTDDVLAKSRAAAAGADVVLASPLVWPARLTAEAAGAAFAYLSVQPSMAATRAFPCPIVLARDRGPAINRFTYAFRDTALSPGRGRLRRAARSLGLPPSRAREAQDRFRGEPSVRLQVLSAALVPAPDDWPAQVRAVPPLEPRAPPEPMPPALEAFLEAGPPPIFIGFGSMPPPPPERAVVALRALRATGARAVVQRGFARDRMEGPDVFMLDRAPFDALFPRCAAIVHHGGGGTTHTALRSGRPQAISPFFADQPWYAWRAHEAGVAVRPLPPRLAVAERSLRTVFTQLLEDADLAARARAAGLAARREDGPELCAEYVLALCDAGSARAGEAAPPGVHEAASSA